MKTRTPAVVFYANYLKFLERARTEWLRGLGVNSSDLAEREHRLFVVHSLDMSYRKPARLDDLITIRSRITRIGRASIHFAQRAERNWGTACPGQHPNLLRRFDPYASGRTAGRYSRKTEIHPDSGINMQVTNDMSLLSLISHASVPVQLIMLLLLGISRSCPGPIFSPSAWQSSWRTNRPAASRTTSGRAATWPCCNRRWPPAATKQGALARIFDAGMTEFLKARRTSAAGDVNAVLDGPRRAMRAGLPAKWTLSNRT